MSDAFDQLEEEALAEEAPKPVRVKLVTENGEAAVHVPPIEKWRSRARHALLVQGDDYTWAESVLSDKDLDTWMDLDPNMEELGAFLESWGKATGMDAGKARRSTSSSSRTRKR